MNRIPFVRHRTANQIRAKYRSCRHPVEKVRWHALWLLARTDEPRTPAQVAGLVGLSDVTVRAVVAPPVQDTPDGFGGQPDEVRDPSRGAGVVGPGGQPQGVPPGLLDRVPARHVPVSDLARRQVADERQAVHGIPSRNNDLREDNRESTPFRITLPNVTVVPPLYVFVPAKA